jgi:hypothetical protein
MNLVDEIIEMARDGKRPLADALRKCLILSYELKNEKLKDWASGELNGFRGQDDISEYRNPTLYSKGTFSGIGGARLVNRPLPLSVLKVEHWNWLTNNFSGLS